MGTSTAARVRALRLSAGLTQEQLAVHAGITAKTLANVENENGHRPHPGTLLLISRALDCDVAELTGEPEAQAA